MQPITDEKIIREFATELALHRKFDEKHQGYDYAGLYEHSIEVHHGKNTLGRVLLAEMDAEMEAEGVEDATAWERWGEYEAILYSLAENEIGIR